MKINRQSYLSSFLLLASCLFTDVTQACPKTNCVRAGSWNIEWLGSSNRKQPIDKSTIGNMAELIANELSIDIITLQEINTQLDGKHRGEYYSLDPWRELQSALKKRGYKTKVGDSGYAQHVVIAWRDPVVVIQNPKDLDVPDRYNLHEFCNSSMLRKPLAGLFRANQFDFWFVGVHLKSSGHDAKCSAAIRRQQTLDLLEAIKPLAKQDADILLLGDFNASGRNPSLQALTKTGYLVLDDKDKRNSASNTHSYHSETSRTANSGSLIDHVMITQATMNEWQKKSTTIYKTSNPGKFANTFSDHLPLWADFYINHDDD